MINRLKQIIINIIGFILFVLVLFVLQRLLKEYHIHDIIIEITRLKPSQLLIAFFLTVFSYLIMISYDQLGTFYIRQPLSYKKIFYTSFISHTFSLNAGSSWFIGGAVRYRLYSLWGLSGANIVQLVTFCGVSLALGFFSVSGIIFLLEPIKIPNYFHLPFQSINIVGVFFLLLPLTYLASCLFIKKELRFRVHTFSLPSFKMALVQILLSSIDWVFSGGVLYFLFPLDTSVSFPSFLAVYFLALIAGWISHIPAGLGVFETVILLLLSPHIPAPVLLGSLLVYRTVYYFIPFFVAVAILATYEFFQKKEKIRQFFRFLEKDATQLLPAMMVFLTFFGGVILLFSGAIPLFKMRLGWIEHISPLFILEISHFIGSLVGMGLLFLSWGLHRRLQAAFQLTRIMLSAGIVISLLKGLQFEEAIIFIIILASISTCKKFFYRKTSFIGEPFSMGWTISIILILGTSVWLGFFSHKHIEYSNELWWRFAFFESGPRFLRASVGAASLALLFGLFRLFRPSYPKPVSLYSEIRTKIQTIVSACPDTYASLALLGDKKFLFSPSQNTFLMYGVEGRSWVAMGDPIGIEEEKKELIWQFKNLCDRYNGWTVFYNIEQKHMSYYQDLSLACYKLGEEGRVLLENFTLEGKERRDFRYNLNHLEKQGCSFDTVSAANVPMLYPQLKKISDSWLTLKNTKEKSFSLAYLNEEYLNNFTLAIVRLDNRIIAFANMILGANKHELSLDLMRYLPEAPNGVMEFLILNLILWGKKNGFHWFNLGMAPFSGLEQYPLFPLWNKFGTVIFRFGEPFYNFQGLRQFKDKFDPVWESKYLACPGGFPLPRIITNLGTLISGGLKGMVTK